MTFTLYGVEYPFKFSIGAMKSFKEKTGKCMWGTTIKLLKTLNECTGKPALHTICALGDTLDFHDSAYFLYLIAKEENSKIDLSAIQDGMIHAGMMPSEDGLTQPYQLVMTEVAHKVFEYQQQLASEKKPQAVS